MTSYADLDYRPLTRTGGLRARLGTVGRSTTMLIGTTVIVLVVLVPLVVLVALLATGNATDGGGVACLVLLVLGGLYGLYDVWAKAGLATSLAAFAQANDLVVVSGTMAPSYAGSLFADREASVDQSVRTRGHDFVEVGDRFPAGDVTLGDLRRGPRERQVFLRARLAGGAAHDPAEGVRVSPGLYDELVAFAGPHEVELTAEELTLFGTRPLGADDPHRVREAFRLVEALAAGNARSAPVAVDTTVTPTPRRRRPVLVVLGVLAMLVVLPVAFAGVMAGLQSVAGGPGPALGVLALVAVGVLMLAVSAVVRRLASPRKG